MYKVTDVELDVDWTRPDPVTLAGSIAIAQIQESWLLSKARLTISKPGNAPKVGDYRTYSIVTATVAEGGVPQVIVYRLIYELDKKRRLAEIADD